MLPSWRLGQRFVAGQRRPREQIATLVVLLSCGARRGMAGIAGRGGARRERRAERRVWFSPGGQAQRCGAKVGRRLRCGSAVWQLSPRVMFTEMTRSKECQ